MNTKMDIKNTNLINKTFKRKDGLFVNVKLTNNYVYFRGERKFDMCIGETIDEAINTMSGPWMFTNNIYSAIRKGNLVKI
jgi:hypothetical protein